LPHPLCRLSLGFAVIAINRFSRLLRLFSKHFIYSNTGLLAFWSSVNTRCTDFAATWCMSEFFWQNCLAWFKADACIFSNLSDRQTAILENQITCCIYMNSSVDV
jgi:hypothetical protein